MRTRDDSDLSVTHEDGPPSGLTGSEASRRLVAHGPNTLPAAARDGVALRVLRELREPMAVLLLVAAILSGVLLGEVVDAIAILTIVVVNAVIALVQQGRAERALDSLKALEAPDAVVVRDGARRMVAAADLVPGDLVVVHAGDKVPADIRVLEAAGLQADESILTGESLPVAKHAGGDVDDALPLGDRDGLLHSGTLVTQGSGLGVVSATGIDTALGRIAHDLTEVGQEPTPLQRQLTTLSRRLGLAALVIASATFGLVLLIAALTGGAVEGGAVGVEEAFLTAVALAVAAVPEGLAAVTTVALALGVARMAGRGAIVRRLPAVETLGATDVLVIDKTGTVTENRMHPAAVLDVEGQDHAPDAVPSGLMADLAPALVLCNDATLDPPTGDPTERALLELAGAGTVAQLRQAHRRRAAAPFTSERKRMSTVNDVGGANRLLVKGAPEEVVGRCRTRRAGDGQVAPLTEGEASALLQRAERRAGAGQRVLAFAERPLADTPDDVELVEAELTLLALVALRDPPRDSARGSVAAAHGAGLVLLMATGDHPATAAAIAAEVGLGHGAPVTGRQLRDEGLPEDPTSVRIYARVDPDQKLALVERLQERGHTVGMTGDGVNDAPALKRADIGVALGLTGSDVAREAADLVVTDDDLATIVQAIEEGRGIYDNIRKVVDYLVTSNLAEIAIVLSTLVLLPSFGVPLFPLQLLWINLLTDGLPALALGVDPVDPALMSRPPRSRADRLLSGSHLRHLSARAAVLSTAAVGMLLVAVHGLGFPTDQARTVLFSTLVLSQVLYAFVIHGPRAGRGPRQANRWLWLSAAVAVVLHVLIVLTPVAQVLFDTVALTAGGWALVLAGGMIGPALLHLWERRGVVTAHGADVRPRG